MKAESIGSKKYSLSDDNGKSIGTLSYEGWFSQKAQATFQNSFLSFKPEGFWGTSIEVVENSKHLASISMNWLGGVSIKTANGIEYSIKHKGFWNSKFVLFDNKKEPLLEFNPSFKWSKWAYEYDIQVLDKKILDDHHTIFIAFYATIFIFRTMTKGAA
ncbi:MAG: hypothetical protein MUC49_07335 [Raineya sp.]|jgi:hypothetical protein|nr:hypothetical protein [Raineya sp.]